MNTVSLNCIQLTTQLSNRMRSVTGRASVSDYVSTLQYASTAISLVDANNAMATADTMRPLFTELTELESLTLRLEKTDALIRTLSLKRLRKMLDVMFAKLYLDSAQLPVSCQAGAVACVILGRRDRVIWFIIDRVILNALHVAVFVGRTVRCVEMICGGDVCECTDLIANLHGGLAKTGR
jgi:hypothetical protein